MTDIEEMRARVDGGDLNAESEINFLFALAKATEDGGNFDGRLAILPRRERQAPPRKNTTTRLARRLRMTAWLKSSIRNVLAERSGQGHPDPAPIFVVGLPRSGSTLIEQILASHSKVEGTSELPYVGHVSSSLNLNRADGVNYPEAVRELGPEHLKSLGQEYLRAAQMHRTEGAPYFIDKMPNNFPFGGIHPYHPAERQNYRCPAPSAGFMPQLFSAAVRQAVNPSPTT